MQSWSRPPIPRLSDSGLGTGPQLHVHDTARRTVVPSAPDGAARLYVCGITPYDATHLGHANTYLAFDLLQRQWLDQGLEVHYTQNVTDVDDPLLERANATGIDWVQLAERETQLFREDMTALRILPPEHYIGAVESIPLVIDLVRRLEKTGGVYKVDDDLYFEVRSSGTFGEVSGFDTETMLRIFPERGGDPDRAGKRDPLDCLLWQAERPGEPAWDTELGRGRPGWHIECAAIALHHLGTAFDVQGGGSDLVFPHHEMSAAEAEAATGEPFARAYVHAGMVGYEGEKMSKSKGNLVLVSKLRAEGHDPMAIRLALLAHHYREDWEWFAEAIDAAEQRLATWRAAADRSTGPSGEELVERLRAALANDLDAPAALAAVDEWAATQGTDVDGPRTVRAAVDALLGVAL
ncbi:cysteine--1-D-myo-inosityl 2-amino-2-deoxy-alpha-D-glucopyranoside ligase [Aeromicrobium tamlense]|uniref:L-cysteine:1D-myo-inositol 2-amino-2-deoxy-alpha-D-glucopyranoside ligase n=1 Tax=Aeromicrobium tamlense TaxID=375541 RepID=A0A8I0KLT9_9ACTN|nr:cysteine--1-D-myo-inosityl 2-amino-2-deoxy-alpha-D-glucopyranoside ligase [Aeromicrobium tamlense]MBD1270428.1 cysteine--1-D-myo-inosityl 2-amino-2-deoxy-alpha-D-glucopyranoside ligase [Aeromicrobium tamlense]MBD1271440.1 cysteine--1-D-myo-inosityl 2-amino-2-deoxy-alpha-D-glucopyranoside ligase [Aeromicrobium tamlense]NYI37815.1 L-cysteine:1D-myo-inositol 2-amino-2-deoxy-alpha-D-glucopyranoside ligase [Aeromicrobium tamlense]